MNIVDASIKYGGTNVGGVPALLCVTWQPNELVS